MSKYIDKAKLAQRLLASPIFKNTQNGDLIRDAVIDIVCDYPTADVVEVVRCKDCKHRYVPCRCALWYASIDGKDIFGERGENFYCGYGERKDDDKDN